MQQGWWEKVYIHTQLIFWLFNAIACCMNLASILLILFLPNIAVWKHLSRRVLFHTATSLCFYPLNFYWKQLSMEKLKPTH
uniref:Uncharacterized protein n=1 Tax=Anguilla anguilla TaxID=7936 RepID=A0A0E9X973_ANGAN